MLGALINHLDRLKPLPVKVQICREKHEAINIMTLSCPKCGNKTRKNGINKTTGLQKYRCNCGWSDSGAIYGVGRPSILGDRSLTNAERSRRKREKARKQIAG
jgi:predicted RNA-binding Zn-ribbon protein involved in translation (DUF1610 family)